jgi:predicted aminopeptidase
MDFPLSGKIRLTLLRGLLLTALLACVGVTGCSSIGYYIDSVSGQMELWRRERSIRQVLDDTEVDSTLKIRLARVNEIRAFASRELELPDNGSYKGYADLKRPYVVWNVFAAEEFSVKPREWCFPFAGCVSYRGYFAQADAADFARGLRNLDIFIGGVPAYSTLGWFNDPILNTFVNYPETEMARLIFHELAHQVIYVKDDSVFNESFAVAVETEGIERWLARHGTPEQRQRFALAQERKEQVAALVGKYRKRLSELYGSSLAVPEKRAAKAAAFADMRTEYQALKASWGGYAGYDRMFGGELNNATLASIAIYSKLVPAFSALLQRANGDMGRFYALVRQTAKLPKAERTETLRALAGKGALHAEID